MKAKKRISLLMAFMIILVTVVSCFATPASALNFKTGIDLHSQAVYMYNMDTGEVVVSIRASEQRVPASLTKIMTCVIVLDTYKNDLSLLETKKVSAGVEAFEELWGTGCSTADIQMDEEVSYYDLLHALMIPSGCEAANIIAVNISGSIDAFVNRMNAKARELGMTNTHFSNAHGLFAEDNYTTCEDMAKLCEYAIETYPLFNEIVSKPNYTMAPTTEHPDGTLIVNTNKMLHVGSEYYYPYATGIKTGNLNEAGRCLASTASKDGMTYLIVSMGAPSKDEDGNSVMYNCEDHVNLYTWAFSQLEYPNPPILSPDSELTDIEVKYGDERTKVNLKPATGFECLWPKAQQVYESDSAEVKSYKQSIEKVTDIKKKIVLKDDVVAPVNKGDVLGYVELTYNGTVLAKIDLVATESVERSTLKEKKDIAKSFWQSTHFKVVIGVVIALVVIYFVVFILIVKSKTSKKKKRRKKVRKM